MKAKNLFKALGPGILFASTAIGVSHLVQSTQAGADFGFSLLWAVLLANLFKYPFFEYGSRYANVTGESLIDGYQKLGKFALFTYAVICLVSTILVTAAVGFVTAGFMQNLFGWSSTSFTTLLLFLICVLILITGRYNLLDRLIKIIALVLLLTTVVTFTITLNNGPQGDLDLFTQNWFPESKVGVLFLLALMGWMPTAVDISAWSSLWVVARVKQTGYKPKLKETLFDFNFGYILTALLSICFLTMGAYIIYGTDQQLPQGAAGFASGIVGLYTSALGKWAYLFIASAAFSIMFSTCITVIDGYSRSMNRLFEILKPQNKTRQSEKSYNWFVLGTAASGLLAILLFQSSNFGMKGLVNVATSMSFIMAPFVAWFNIKLVRKKYLGENSPPKWMVVLSYLGLLFLSGFSLYFIWIKFISPLLFT